MAHLLGDLVKYFAFDEINIDNVMFKLYYKASMVTHQTEMTEELRSL